MNHINFCFLCIIFSKTQNSRKFFPTKYTAYTVFLIILYTVYFYFDNNFITFVYKFNYFPCSVIPSLLEYFSYNFCFMNILAGPTVAYKDYDNFITGRSITEAKTKEVS